MLPSDLRRQIFDGAYRSYSLGLVQTLDEASRRTRTAKLVLARSWRLPRLTEGQEAFCATDEECAGPPSH